MDVVAALAASATIADLHRAQFDAENRMTPQEVAALAAEAAALPEAARPWIARLAGMVRRIRPEPEPYRRRAIAEGVTLFEAEGAPGARRDLVIGFCGEAHRLMMPVAPVLQAFPAARCDVLVLADASQANFLLGLPGYAADPVALATRLSRDLPLSRYAALRCFGTSAGGAAALGYGAGLGARVAMSLGGAHPLAMSERRIQGRDIDRLAFDRAIAAAPPGRTRLLCVHGQKHARDVVRTRLQSIALPGGRAIAVEGIAQHGVIAGLFLRDAMVRFFEEMLLSDSPPEGGVWRPAVEASERR